MGMFRFTCILFTMITEMFQRRLSRSTVSFGTRRWAKSEQSVTSLETFKILREFPQFHLSLLEADLVFVVPLVTSTKSSV